MTNWILKVELNGEWEECRFATYKEALSTFVALARDYTVRLKRAILLKDTPESRILMTHWKSSFVN